jgi:hypothetical protein
MPPPPELDRPSGGGYEDPEQSKEISRRLFLVGAVSAGVLAGVAHEAAVLDHELAVTAYPGGDSAILTGVEARSAQDLPFAERRVLFVGGFNDDQAACAGFAAELQVGPYKDVPVSYTAFAPQGIRCSQLTDEYEALERATGHLEVVARSMGLLTLLNIFDGKLERSSRYQTVLQAADHAPGKALSAITFCGTPTSIYDTNFAPLKKLIDRLQPAGTMSEKALLKAADIMANHGQHDVSAVWEQVQQQLFDRAAPGLCASQLRILAATDAMRDPRQYGAFFTPATRTINVVPADVSADSLVNVTQAAAHLQTFTRETKSAFGVCKLAGAGHADVGRMCLNPVYRQWVRQQGTPV